MDLGDAVERALRAAGIDRDRVERWLGRHCRCEARKAKLNALSAWARRVVKGRLDEAGKFLEGILGDD